MVQLRRYVQCDKNVKGKDEIVHTLDCYHMQIRGRWNPTSTIYNKLLDHSYKQDMQMRHSRRKETERHKARNEEQEVSEGMQKERTGKEV